MSDKDKEREISKKIIKEYLLLRGYRILEKISTDQIKDFYTEKLFLTDPKTNINYNVIWTDKVGKGELRALNSSPIWKDYVFIIIYDDKVTNECIKDITILNSNMKKVELFKVSELQYNIFCNTLVHPSELLDEEEKKIVIESYEPSKLPKILSQDPVCRYLGLKIGDILKISRGKFEPFYRIVV